MKVLCVGGPLDGERIDDKAGVNTFCSCEPSYDKSVFQDPVKTIDYVVHRHYQSDLVLACPVDWGPEQVFNKLLEGYRP
jgi:hypothetical protein